MFLITILKGFLGIILWAGCTIGTMYGSSVLVARLMRFLGMNIGSDSDVPVWAMLIFMFLSFWPFYFMNKFIMPYVAPDLVWS